MKPVSAKESKVVYRTCSDLSLLEECEDTISVYISESEKILENYGHAFAPKNLKFLRTDIANHKKLQEEIERRLKS